jgi:DNA repair exonuclease SbcCD nuclease subunit
MFKFIHAADIHLDSPLRGLERYEGAPVERIRGATREALRALVRLAIEEKVAFVVIAGDLFDGDWKDYNTGLFFASQMAVLRAEGIRVFLVTGNHDAASTFSKKLKLPENVHRFSERKPESVRLESPSVVLHGQSFARKEVRDNLAAAYPDAVPGAYNIGILHTCGEGREGHESYAPCKLDDLRSKGYEYWALGHVHRREILSESPWIVFSGNVQGRHIRETGAKGCTLVSVDNEGRTTLEARTLDVLRWACLSIDARLAESADQLLDHVQEAIAEELAELEGHLLAVRLEIAGTSPIHATLEADPDRWINEIRAASLDAGGGEVWVEKIHLQTRMPVDLDQLAESDTPVAKLLTLMSEFEQDPELLAELTRDWQPLRGKLPSELRLGEDRLDLESTQSQIDLLEEARQILLPRLLETEAQR